MIAVEGLDDQGMERHRIPALDGAGIVLHRRPGVGEPVVLVPGTFGSRQFWTGRRGEGFDQALSEAGYDVWILETRCHGDSDWVPGATIDQWIRLDAPAAVEYICQTSGSEKLVWVGHSAGGVTGVGLCGSGHPAAEHIRAMVLLGTPAPGAQGIRRWGARLSAFLSRLTPHFRFPGRWIGFGGGYEPARLIDHWMSWNVAGRWVSEEGKDYLSGLRTLPVLSIGGAGDTLLAPPHSVRALLDRFPGDDRTLVIAGERAGFQEDFGHAGLVRGDPARREIWPLVMDWLNRPI